MTDVGEQDECIHDGRHHSKVKSKETYRLQKCDITGRFIVHMDKIPTVPN